MGTNHSILFSGENMWIKKKEIFLAIALSTLVVLLVTYSSLKNEKYPLGSFLSMESEASGERTHFGQGSQQHYQLITETIEGQLNKGTFEDAINKLTILTESKDGYVKSLHMTYTEGAWGGQMICKVPPANVTSFTFGVRAIIDANGTVTYINISIEDINATQQTTEATFSTINLNLNERKPDTNAGIGASMEPGLGILKASLLWIAQGLIVGVPLCFASLGIVILVNRGIIPVWKNLLKGTKQPGKNSPVDISSGS